ncbi:hypothetical protein V1519DRAFT_362103, partial [Lipomyces tetrasporus]
IKHYEWVQMYKRTRDKAITEHNIQGAVRRAGLFPYNPQKVVRHIPESPPAIQQIPRTFGNQGDLNSLLKSSPDGTELRESIPVLRSILNSQKRLLSPVKRYINRLAHVAE